MVRVSGRLALAILWSALGLSACGGKSNVDEPGGGSHAGGNGASGNGTSGSATSRSGAGGVAECSEFADDAGWSVTVRIVNETSGPIHLGQQRVNCSIEPVFQVRDASGTLLRSLDDCRSSCQEMMRSGPAGCGAICAFPSAITLRPREATRVSWSGLFEVQATLPGQCRPKGQGSSGECSRAQQIEPGNFVFSAQAGSGLDCSQTTGGVCSPCMNNDSGGCTTPGSLISGTLLSAELKLPLDAGYGVGAGGGAEALPVELVFKD